MDTTTDDTLRLDDELRYADLRKYTYLIRRANYLLHVDAKDADQCELPPPSFSKPHREAS